MNNKNKLIRFKNGVIYTSERAMCRDHNIDPHTYRTRRKKNPDKSPEELVYSVNHTQEYYEKHKDKNIINKNRKSRNLVMDHNQNIFPTKEEMCRAYNKTSNQYYTRINQNMSQKEALKRAIGETKGKKNPQILPEENCDKVRLEWLLKEYVEPVLTDKEKAYLKSIIEFVRNDITNVKKTTFTVDGINELTCIAISGKNPCYGIELIKFLTNTHRQACGVVKTHSE